MNDKTSNYGDKVRARQLRRDMTAAETVLWKHLRGSGAGFRFRRQHPIGPYVLDFYSYELNLCIELDGDVHEEAMADVHDTIRTEYLNKRGITVLRYSNDVVFKDDEGILRSIANYSKKPVLLVGWHKDELIGDGSDPL